MSTIQAKCHERECNVYRHTYAFSAQIRPITDSFHLRVTNNSEQQFGHLLVQVMIYYILKKCQHSICRAHNLQHLVSWNCSYCKISWKITDSYTCLWLHANPGNKVVRSSECSTTCNLSCFWSSKLQKCKKKTISTSISECQIQLNSVNPYSYSTNTNHFTWSEVQPASSGSLLMWMHLSEPLGLFYCTL